MVNTKILATPSIQRPCYHPKTAVNESSAALENKWSYIALIRESAVHQFNIPSFDSTREKPLNPNAHQHTNGISHNILLCKKKRNARKQPQANT